MLIGLIYWFELSNYNILILMGYGEELAYLECLMAGNKSISPLAHKTHP
jgi:ketol-acid reductoisomerase